MKKTLFIFTVVVLMITAISQSVWAFSDTKNDPNADKISALQDQGIVLGSNDGTFKPKDKLTYAAGITIVVKGLGLNLNGKQFFKQPLATDYFTKANNQAWYSESFVIAGENNLDLPRDLDPAAVMSREQFAHLLFRGIMATGDYAFIEIFVDINDQSDIASAYMDSIQKLLIANIVKLDAKHNFYPKEAITRGEAAGWLFDAINFVKENKNNIPPVEEQPPFPLTDLAISVKAINADVNEVTVTAQAPNPGYGMRIASLLFDGDQAIINIEPTFPKKDMMYPQVVTQVKAVTYVSSAYKPVLGANSSSDEGSAGSGAIAAEPSEGISSADGSTIH
ncbi:S-layer homology domain-containing protein [Paenibacillus solisilvae]|uniref:S-layer homology domain-containing protein n=1 Tax=Paenibacillus solisilvae TaxID=2486751 RepID=A0ABW0W4F2_9BACL